MTLLPIFRPRGGGFYHLELRATSRATLARVNEFQPHDLYRDLFYSLLNRCQLYAPKNRFEFNGKIYLLDETVINLCLSIFPWATLRKTKGAIKLHFGLDADGYLPLFMDMTKGKFHESTWAKALSMPSGSTVVFDRGFNDYSWYQSLTDHHVVFVTRLKSNAVFEPLQKRRGRKGQGICGDRRIRLKDMAYDLRIVDFTDSTTGPVKNFV